jgi:hypothetical protein
MKLEVKVKQMFERLACNPAHGGLPDAGEDSIQEFGG